MKAEILSVGTELLLGDIVNTDAAYIARALSSLGITLHHQTVVGDNRERLKNAAKNFVCNIHGLFPANDSA